MKKLYLLDTNVLIHNPRSIFSFEGALVGIPSVVLEELDTFKKDGTDKGRASRAVIRSLDELRAHGSLKEGVALDNGGRLQIFFAADHQLKEDFPFETTKNDNIILLTAVGLKEQGYEVHLISKDINVRIKADALGIATEDYEKEYVTPDELYKGWRTVSVPSIQLKHDEPQGLLNLIEGNELTLNEFVLLESQNNAQNYRVFRYVGGKRGFIAVHEPSLKWPIKSRNAQQLMALDLLFDKNILCVNLIGTAGTGKTFLALLAGLHQVLIEEAYEKMLVARPVIPLGKDIGFLPGTLQEKLFTWMLPVYDNMQLIIHTASEGQQAKEQEASRDHREPRHKKGNLSKHGQKWSRPERGALHSLEDLIHRGKISLEAITYMRGRSIPYQFIIIDEVQNLTPHEVKTLVSRVGEGSKIILAGDPYQIDSTYLDFSSNGLVSATEKLKGQSIFGSVYLATSERSVLSQLAADLL